MPAEPGAVYLGVQRGRAMALSVARAAKAAGMGEAGVDLVGRAHALGMERRAAALDEHAPAFLHPGRSVLVLLRDVGALPPEVLAATAVHESEHPTLRVPAQEVASRLGDAVASILEALPLPDDERLSERLVLLDREARLAALAERLDHLRHAHLEHDLARWRALHAQTGAVWLPLAERTHPRLATRYRHWHAAFARRLNRVERRL